jgi:hypothetical protein
VLVEVQRNGATGYQSVGIELRLSSVPVTDSMSDEEWTSGAAYLNLFLPAKQSADTNRIALPCVKEHAGHTRIRGGAADERTSHAAISVAASPASRPEPCRMLPLYCMFVPGVVDLNHCG